MIREMETLVKRIKGHEGRRDLVYLDSRGNLTCGWGHHLYVGSKVPVEVSEAFLKQDIAQAVNDFYKLKWTFDWPIMKRLNTVRKRIIVEMLFNLGFPKVLGFKKMWECIENKDWPGAKKEMLASKWHDQVGKRAETLAELMEKGHGTHL